LRLNYTNGKAGGRYARRRFDRGSITGRKIAVGVKISGSVVCSEIKGVPASSGQKSSQKNACLSSTPVMALHRIFSQLKAIPQQRIRYHVH